MWNSVIFVSGQQRTLDAHGEFLAPLVTAEAECSYEWVLTHNVWPTHASSLVITTKSLEQWNVSWIGAIRQLMETKMWTKDFPWLIIFDYRDGHLVEDFGERDKIVHTLPDLSRVIREILALK